MFGYGVDIVHFSRASMLRAVSDREGIRLGRLLHGHRSCKLLELVTSDKSNTDYDRCFTSCLQLVQSAAYIMALEGT